MNREQAQVRTFHRDVLDQPYSPAEPKLRNPELRANLILEEAIETVTALVGSGKAVEMLRLAVESAMEQNFDKPTGPDLVEVIDGLCDTVVVCYGTAESIGIDLEPFYHEVMRSNFTKVNGPVRADGKRGKPPGWTPPDIAGILAKVVGGK